MSQKRTSWTEEAVRQVASLCKNKRDLQIRFVGAYKAAVRLNILTDIFPTHSQIQWTDAMLAAEAGKYSTRGAFATGSASAYVLARQRGLLDAIAPPKLIRSHSEDSLKALADQYETRTDFARGDSGAYSTAQRAGILDLVCPPNVGGVSKGELSLLSFLQSISPDFSKKKFGMDYELDCFSPSLKLGVEYNGLYWHSSANPKMHRQYHLAKTKYFEALGIRVIHIWEHEWANRMPQVKNYLQSACGVNSIRIGARKCLFKEIEPIVARTFLQQTHIQGAPIQIMLALGCFYQDELIGVTSFGRHHRQNMTDIVLNRFACLPGHTIIGGLAKTSKTAFDQLGPLKSWADYCKSQGRGYIAAGWKLERLLYPDYFYTDKASRYVSKQSRKKSIAGTPAGMTELEHAKKENLHRIWDCGKLVLSYKGD